MNNTAHNGFKKGDIVRNTVSGKEYTFIEYQDVFTARVENSILEVYSYSLDYLELVTPVSKTPRTDEAIARGGAVIVDHARALEREVAQLTEATETYRTELDAARGVAEAAEEEVETYKSAVDSWKAAATQAQRNADHYHSLLVQCGEAIGKEAYVADDGTTQQDVLVAKVPELVRGLVNKRDETINLIYDIMRDEVNVIDECEKWLRAYAPGKLREAYDPKPDHTEGGSRVQIATPVENPEVQEDYAQQAKDMFVKNTFADESDADTFVDLIIKAAKQ